LACGFRLIRAEPGSGDFNRFYFLAPAW
jgi:hypothetical protein